MIDSHCHVLSEYYENIDQLVKDLKENNMLKIINCSDKLETAKEVIELSNKYSNFIVPAIGIHPENVSEINKMDELESMISNNIKAIGEIGLDFYYSKDNYNEQIELFNKQLDLAEKYNLPVIVHTRKSINETYEILSKHKLKGSIHCFNGSIEYAKKFIKLGYKLGVGGILTFKNCKLYELIEQLDLKDLLLETDSPYLSPEPLRGKTNIPSNVYFVAKKLAEIKGVTIDDVIKITTNNAREVFDI